MDLNSKFIITISREAGSGGRSIGREVARKLNVSFCDKQVLQGLMEKFNLNETEIERIKAQKKKWFEDFATWFSPAPAPGMFVQSEESPKGHSVQPEDLFIQERAILKGLAEERSCVIAGRFGFFLLQDYPNKVDILIRAPREQRINRIALKQGVSPEEAGQLIDRIDAARETYIKRISGLDRYDSRNYNLMLDMANLTEEQAVQCILDYIGIKA